MSYSNRPYKSLAIDIEFSSSIRSDVIPTAESQPADCKVLQYSYGL